MPHLRVRGVSVAVVQKFSEGLSDELASALETSPDNFTIEAVSSVFFENGRTVEGYPFIEIHLFPRAPEMKAKTAQLITDRFRALGVVGEIAVVFYRLSQHDYFENGAHF